MGWTLYLSCFIGGAFVTNALPHFVSGCMGRAFQSPFASPPGRGLSSSVTNVLWGFFNLIIGYLLLWRVAGVDMRAGDQVAALGFGILVMGLVHAVSFGRLHGGNLPEKK